MKALLKEATRKEQRLLQEKKDLEEKVKSIILIK